MTDQQKLLLGLGGVTLGAIWFMRRKTSSVVNQPVSTTGQIAPYTPQAVTTLQPGESVYDPNSQALLTTPAPIDTTGGVSGNGVPGVQATTPSAPAYSVNVSYAPTVTRTVNRAKPTKRVIKKHPQKKVKHG